MTEQSVHVVAGAGPLGRAVVRALTARDVPVRVVSRSGSGIPGVDDVRADVTDPDEARRACAGAAVVYGCAQPGYAHWPDGFPPIQAGLLAGAESAGAVYVSAENTYLYGLVDGPLVESLPAAATTRKGRVRARLAAAVLDAHASGRVRTTAGRGSDFYGPGVLGSAVGDRFFGPLVEGRAVRVVGDPSLPHTYTYIDDFGRALVTLGDDERAWGQAWHVPSPPTTSTLAFAEAAARLAGTSPKVKRTPRWLLSAVGRFNPDAREVVEMLYEFEHPFVVDHSAYAATFGDDATAQDDALAATVAWYRSR